MMSEDRTSFITAEAVLPKGLLTTEASAVLETIIQF